MAWMSGAASGAGGGAWQSLRSLVTRGGDGEEDRGRAALDRLEREPGDPGLAQELADALAERARQDPDFLRELRSLTRMHVEITGNQHNVVVAEHIGTLNLDGRSGPGASR